MHPRHDAQVLAAFAAAAGIPIETVVDAIRLSLGGLALIWLVWVISRLGSRWLHNELSDRKAMGYAIRAAVLTTLVLFVLAA